MLSEKVDQLLLSSVLEDVVIGIKLAYNEVGEGGLKKIFIFDPDRRAEHFYKYSNKYGGETAVVEFETFSIYIGPICVEYYSKEKTEVSQLKRRHKIY